MRYISLITSGLFQWLPDFWTLTQQRMPGLASIDDAAPAVERGMAAAERGVAQLLHVYRSAAQKVLNDPAASGLSHCGLLSIGAKLAACCDALQAAPAGGSGAAAGSVASLSPPAAVVECLRQLTEQALLGSLGQLATHSSAAVAALCATEDFCLTCASRRTGAPATASMARLQQLVQQSMQHLQAALGVAAQADVQPLHTLAAPARNAFLGCFSAFAAGTDGVAAAILQDLAGGAAGSGVAARALASHQQASWSTYFCTVIECGTVCWQAT